MITRYENKQALRLTINHGDHGKTELAVGRDNSGDGLLILGLHRGQPLFDVTAFISFDEARELAEALTLATGEWEPKKERGLEEAAQS